MNTKTHAIINLIKDIFNDEDELDKFNKFIDYNNDKEIAESILKDMNRLLSYNIYMKSRDSKGGFTTQKKRKEIIKVVLCKN